MRSSQRRQRETRPSPQRDAPARNRPNDRAGWQRRYDHYLAQALAYTRAGDKIEAENCYQHADHYVRLLQGTEA